MNELKAYKRLTWALIILNLAVIGFFVFAPHPQGGHGPFGPKHSPKEHIENLLNFDHAQKEKFHDLIQQHIEQIKKQDEIIIGIRQKMYEAYFHNQSTDSLESQLRQTITDVEKININHLQDIRKICTIEQQSHFDEIVKNWARIFTAHPIKP